MINSQAHQTVAQTLAEYPTVLHILQKWAYQTPECIALRWFEKGKVKSEITYKVLWQSIDSCAVEILKVIPSGNLVFLLFEPGLEFYIFFYACLRAGIVAVPYYPPLPSNPQIGIDLVAKLLNSAQAKFILMSQKLKMLKMWRGKWPERLSSGEKMKYMTLSVPSKPQHCLQAMPSPADVAFLQFSSGSTSDPKGVIIGHDTFQCNLAYGSWFASVNSSGVQITTKTKFTSWLPQYHDMGLAAAVSATLFTGGEVNLISPFDFLADPLVWFDVISSTRSTHSLAPNFAYGLVVRKWDSRRAKQWDLSALTNLGNSAEPVLFKTVQAFLERMSEEVPSFDVRGAYLPGYGMAECVASIGFALHGTPLITTNTVGQKDLIASVPHLHRFGAFAIVTSEKNESGEETQLRIVKYGEVGEVWYSSDFVARGYWNNEEQTRLTFCNQLPEYDPDDPNLALCNAEGHRNWLRTGDLGAIIENHLYICGRAKDLIILNGRNYYPQDIELIVQQVDEEKIRPGSVVSFAVSRQQLHDNDEEESYAVVCELRNTYLKSLGPSNCSIAKASLEELFRQIVFALKQQIPCDPVDVVFLEEKTIPKTTSGKLQRAKAKSLWATGGFRIIASNQATAREEGAGSVDWLEDYLKELSLNHVIGSGTEESCRTILNQFKIYSPDPALSAQGLDSLQISELFHLITSADDNPSLHVAESETPPELDSLFSWTGKDLVKFVCTGTLPASDQSSLNEVVFASPLASNSPGSLKRLRSFSLDESSVKDSERRSFSPEPSPMRDNGLRSFSSKSSMNFDQNQFDEREQELIRSYSVPKRLVLETIGILCLVLTIVASLIPGIQFYIAFIDYGGFGNVLGTWRLSPKRDSDTIWVSMGVLLILCIPITVVAFTVLVVIETRSIQCFLPRESIAMHSTCYYLWWYSDRLQSTWNQLVFPFVSGTPLVNLVYYMMGGTNISFLSTINTPIPFPEFVSLGRYSEINGNLYTTRVSPEGVRFGGIVVEAGACVGSRAVVHLHSKIERNTLICPLSVVCEGSSCSKDYNWAGNPCQRGAMRESSLMGDTVEWRWVLDRAARMLVVLSLPWGSMISLACAVRFWLLVFPRVAVTSDHVTNFWFSIWMYYGTVIGWSLFVLVFKWTVFGRARPGEYCPGGITIFLRWALAYYHGMVVRQFWFHFFFPLVHLWARLLGCNIHPTATSLDILLVHPADADLVEIQEGANVSAIGASVYDAATSMRKSLVIERNAQVWLWAYLDFGSRVNEGAVVGAGVYIGVNKTVEANTQVSSASPMKPFTRGRSFQLTSLDSSLSLQSEQQAKQPEFAVKNYTPGYNPVLVLLAISLDLAGLLLAISPLWMTYLVYRALAAAGIAQWIMLIIVLLFGWWGIVLVLVGMNRLLQFSFSLHPFIKVIGLVNWKLIDQYRNIYLFLSMFGGTILFNFVMNLAGAKVAYSAKVFSFVFIPDLTLLEIDEYAVPHEHTFILGHQLKDSMLSWNLVKLDRFSSSDPYSLVFSAQRLCAWSRLGSLTTIPSKELKRGMNKVGNQFLVNQPEGDMQFILPKDNPACSPSDIDLLPAPVQMGAMNHASTAPTTTRYEKLEIML